ncbi:hypothetical protein ACC687_41180, partial [Rhizobium ruizarguesonis]
LRLMETTDIHVNVFPYDYYADKPNDTMGLARTGTIIDGIRAEAVVELVIAERANRIAESVHRLDHRMDVAVLHAVLIGHV